MAKKSAKKAAKKGGKQSPLGPFGSAQTPITIGGGSLFVHFKRGDFNHSGDRDNHKNTNVAITHLEIVSSEHSVDMDVTQPMMIIVKYA